MNSWCKSILTGSLLFSAIAIDDVDHWVLCNGGEIAKADYPTLYNKLGAIYGTAGNPATHAVLPDWRARFPVGVGTGTIEVDSVNVNIGSYEIGDVGGEKEHILTVAEMPGHTHANSALVVGADCWGWWRLCRNRYYCCKWWWWCP